MKTVAANHAESYALAESRGAHVRVLGMIGADLRDTYGDLEHEALPTHLRTLAQRVGADGACRAQEQRPQS